MSAGLLGFPQGREYDGGDFSIRPSRREQDFPFDSARLSFASTSDATPTFPMPGATQAGDLIVLSWRAVSGVSVSDAAGFTQLVLASDDASDDTFYVGYKIADGSEGASVTQTISAAANLVSIIWCIKKGGVPTATNVFHGVNGVAKCPLHTPAGGLADYLWLAIGSNEGQQRSFAPPSGYENFVTIDISAGSGTNEATLHGASRFRQADSENPGPFKPRAGGGNSNQWMNATVAIPVAS